MDHARGSRPNHVALAAGGIIGVLWLAMAIPALAAAFQGLARQRGGWWLGWFLVGILLGAAGLCTIGGTLWHQFRVKPSAAAE